MLGCFNLKSSTAASKVQNVRILVKKAKLHKKINTECEEIKVFTL